MTNAELADEIERQIFWEDDIDNEDTFAFGVHLDGEHWQQIIAALRQSDPVLGECEECGHTIVTPLKRFPAAEGHHE